MKAKDKLRMAWSKREKDCAVSWPLGVQTTCDARYMLDVFSKEVIRELDSRGYDVKTLRFSIEPKKGNEKFASQRKNTQ